MTLCEQLKIKTFAPETGSWKLYKGFYLLPWNLPPSNSIRWGRTSILDVIKVSALLMLLQPLFAKIMLLMPSKGFRPATNLYLDCEM